MEARKVDISKKDSSEESSEDIQTIFKGRQSSELVIAMCGPLGCGIREIAPLLKTELENFGYHVESVSLSSLIIDTIQKEDSLSQLRADLPTAQSTGYERYYRLQNAGNAIRDAINTSVIAKLAIAHIQTLRKLHNQNDSQADSAPARKKVAYIVNQLKHPDEANLLRTVYGSIFYLVGVLSKEKERLTRLERDELIETKKAHDLITRDKQEEGIDHGQKLEKTLESADYFIRNKSDNTAAIRKSLERFLQLVHGKNGITPTLDEKGMYAAFSASLESACLSRQVGAAISNDKGHILATGRNDVPKAGGGLYTHDDAENDHRCIHKGAKCYNDEYKNRLKIEIRQILEGQLPNIDTEKLAQKIVKNTQIKSLIEYSRAIHAEMDAIVSLSRNPSQSTLDTTLYATTYPCHNCARHIVAAGIKRVVYIQPYEKSLAEKLHDDAITSVAETGRIPFEPFEGVAPKRYQVFFFSATPRKADGKALIHRLMDVKSVDQEYIDSYLTRETGAMKHLELALKRQPRIPTNNQEDK